MNSSYFHLLANDIKKLWKGLNVPQRFGLFVLLLVTVILSTFFIVKSFEPDLTVLYSDLAETDVANITENLKKNGYSFKLTDDKKTILVPANQRDQMRLYVAENDLIQNSNPGFELLDNMQLGSTDFKNNLTKQRIFQGELTRSIEKMEGIRNVRVQLAQPERSIFSDKDEIPSASVMLILDSGYKLKSSQVKAIKNLVAYSVPRLTPEKVFITDQFGNSLSDETSKNSNDMESFKGSVEKETAKKITSVLEEIVGRGNVSVQVNADIDFNSAKATIERYIPLDEKGEGVLTSTQSEIENYENPNNTNNQQSQNPNAGVPNKNLNYAKERSSTSYSVSKEVKHIVYAPGTIKRLTIAVAVNKILTQPEKEELQNLVLSAAGVDYERGDVITVSGLQFEALEQDKKTQADIAEKQAKETLLDYIVVKLGPSIVILILGLVTITLLKGLISKLPHYDVQNNILDEPEEDDELSMEPDVVDNSGPLRLDGLGKMIDSGYPQVLFDVDDTQSSLQDIEISRQEQSINTLNEAILADPEAAAKVLMSYIKE
ncbi:MAG: flagellar basal-body MS-ring/collar protein FliF [Candidatus Gastranaerophilaceae bacterium]